MIKKFFRTTREHSVFIAIKKTLLFFYRKIISVVGKLYINIFYRQIRSMFKAFSSNEKEEVFNFVSNNFFKQFAPIQVKDEFLSLLEIFSEQRVEKFLEIGTANGGTLFSFLNMASDNALAISIDLPGGKFGGGYSYRKGEIYKSFLRANQLIKLLRQDSHAEETLDRVREILKGEKLDFLFIDGDHSYEGVKQDFYTYEPFVRKGGIIAFHDVAVHPKESDCYVHLFWEEVKPRYNHEEIINDKNQSWGGIGILYKE